MAQLKWEDLIPIDKNNQDKSFSWAIKINDENYTIIKRAYNFYDVAGGWPVEWETFRSKPEVLDYLSDIKNNSLPLPSEEIDWKDLT